LFLSSSLLLSYFVFSSCCVFKGQFSKSRSKEPWVMWIETFLWLYKKAPLHTNEMVEEEYELRLMWWPFIPYQNPFILNYVTW
jgi:hypothetical protein